MGKIRINVLRAMTLLLDGRNGQKTFSDITLKDLQKALLAGDWEVIGDTTEEAYGAG